MKNKIDLIVAQNVSERYIEKLRPFCDKIKVAGSVRRKSPTVGDIEIVCIPKTEEMPDGLFNTKMERIAGFAKTLLSTGIEILKGNPQTGKYVMCMTVEGIQIDLFMAEKNNFGFIYAIRTGSSEFSQFLGKRWVKWGYKGDGGYLWRLGGDWGPDERISTPTEKSFFDLLNLPVVPPHKRNQLGLPS